MRLVSFICFLITYYVAVKAYKQDYGALKYEYLLDVCS